MITVASLITGGNTQQWGFHLNKAKENGISEEELIEVSHIWPFTLAGPKLCLP
ncbi:carboxymuconolactone decarboxylase family protein [Paenibacillus sp. LPE1-1-1.1]|uniref:carboxymuconolactone decarboxylase family protein n=1 Tax=Paenibacillus sp. LPE1-1-1.1 TaxID=3135230 RepID=UPI0039C99F3F